jgi:hypothetical protein
MMSKLVTFVMTAIAAVLLAGCTATAPQYQATNSNAMALAVGTVKIDVAEFGLGPRGNKLNSLSLRGSSYKSPIENSWAAYLREALKSELITGGRYQSGAPVKVSGTLLENELDAGSSTGTARIQARFVAQRNGATVYDKVLTADKRWESSFIGAVAGPLAQQNYIATVSDLLAKLFADSDFVRATN